jgi:hypothetical protein
MRALASLVGPGLHTGVGGTSTIPWGSGRRDPADRQPGGARRRAAGWHPAGPYDV